ncbi:MAG: response regulator [Candidatus Pacebacteria bacterium]|nr:response regulator [Candidatus Paceibacterota bacterium]MCD8528162.1 response regulator [Candidatus Paceibacterota bacterium]MCD8563432.1 response regulator [Candidatus Paceibacterota bacterium]
MSDTHKVLFIEDDDFLRSLVVTKLQKNGFEVATKGDGADALALINQEKPDILLLDLMLPGVGGFEILEAIRNDATWRDLKVIIFSNLGEEEDIQKGEALGASEYMIKSNFTLDELVEKIQSMLA